MDKLLEKISNGAYPQLTKPVPNSKLGRIAIEVRANGDWLYQGALFKRAEMVQLLSRSLYKNEEGYFLLTPEQHLKITVEDLPFTVQTVECVVEKGQEKIFMQSNCGERLLLSKEHTLQLLPMQGAPEPLPALHVRDELFARVVRSAYYHLLEWAFETELVSDDTTLGKKNALVVQSLDVQYIVGYL